MCFSKKGFLGPIGDDLPSLIPLLFGLVIFFATFSFAFQVFDRGNLAFDDAVKIVKISQGLKGDSYLGSAEEFFQSCQEVSVRGLNFKAFIVDYPKATIAMGAPGPPRFKILELTNEYPSTLHNFGVFSVADVPNCPFESLNPCPLACVSSSDLPILTGNERIQTRMFPIAFQDQKKCMPFENPLTDFCNNSGFIVRPLTLVVVTWRG
ncbi:MAG: hypothetical protein Q7S92_07210 [Candidatus Diapherotrites archaeon]|nr:hypothetical protein [Candidatus Diapherotrites archaeon]